MFTIITANAILVWFVWGFLWPSAGYLVLGSWNGCSGWYGAGGLQQDVNFENQRPGLVVTRTGRLSSQCGRSIDGFKLVAACLARSSRHARIDAVNVRAAKSL